LDIASFSLERLRKIDAGLETENRLLNSRLSYSTVIAAFKRNFQRDRTNAVGVFARK
jgi:hypothetical protein